MEYYECIGYNHYKQRYTTHGMSIEGDEDYSEGFSYGYRNGNDFKTVAKFGSDTNIVQHLLSGNRKLQHGLFNQGLRLKEKMEKCFLI